MILFILGLVIGIILMTILASGKMSELLDENYNSELRAVIHFRKLNKIENIMKHSDEIKENYFITINKIKKALVNDYQSKN